MTLKSCAMHASKGSNAVIFFTIKSACIEKRSVIVGNWFTVENRGTQGERMSSVRIAGKGQKTKIYIYIFRACVHSSQLTTW